MMVFHAEDTIPRVRAAITRMTLGLLLEYDWNSTRSQLMFRPKRGNSCAEKLMGKSGYRRPLHLSTLDGFAEIILLNSCSDDNIAQAYISLLGTPPPIATISPARIERNVRFKLVTTFAALIVPCR